MKKVLTVVALACGQLMSLEAQLSLLYPVGGENFPGNGRHTISWTNAASMGVTVYFDWYDTSGTLLVSDNSLYSRVLPAGTNSFVLSTPSRYPIETEHKYKVRLVGTNSTANVTNESGFVYVTDSATLTTTLNSYDPWLPGQNRTNTITWNGFQINETLRITFESPDLHKGDYGFLINNFTLTTPNGTQSIVVPFPSSLSAAYPPASYGLSDGSHKFVLLNERCQISQLSEEVDIVTVGLRMLLATSEAYSIVRGDNAICGSVILDTTLATNNVSVTNVTIILTSFSTNNLSLKFVLKDGSQSLCTNTLNYKPSSNNQYSIKVDFPVNLIVTNGQVKELPLWCEVLTDSETGSFIWTTDEVVSVAQSSVSATYVGGASIGKTVVSSTTSFIDVMQISQPKLLLQTTTNGLATFQIVCKPQVSYTIQSSTNLVDWVNDSTTNTVANTIQFSMSVTNGNKFFRIKEN